MKITVEDVLNSPVVAYPLLALDCCLMSVGAACAIICDEDTSIKLTENTKNKPLRIWVAAWSQTLRPACRRDMEIPLLPNKTEDHSDLEERFPGGSRYPGFTGFLGARMCAYYAYHMTEIIDPTEDLDVVELHDAFTISDVQSYEDIGIRPYGYGRDYVESGDWTDLQVKGAKRGLAISHAEVGSHVTATILMDPDYLLKDALKKDA